MPFLIIRIEPKENDTRPEKDRLPVIEQIVRPGRFGDLKLMSKLRVIMAEHGYECKTVRLGTHVGWPLIAYVYNSKRPDGKGRSGSSLWRMPTRRLNESATLRQESRKTLK